MLRAPRAHLGQAWTDPNALARWLPAPLRCRVVVRHERAAPRARDETFGFADGWGAVTAQLAALCER